MTRSVIKFSIAPARADCFNFYRLLCQSHCTLYFVFSLEEFACKLMELDKLQLLLDITTLQAMNAVI